MRMDFENLFSEVPVDLHHLIPGFNEGVFFIFVVLSFLNQAFVAPGNIDRGAVSALQNAIYFVVPGQRALVSALDACSRPSALPTPT